MLERGPADSSRAGQSNRYAGRTRASQQRLVEDDGTLGASSCRSVAQAVRTRARDACWCVWQDEPALHVGKAIA